MRVGKILCRVALFCTALAVSSPAQTFTSLANFAGTNGSRPGAQLIQGPDGNLWGIASDIAFKVSPAGTITLVHNLCLPYSCNKGSNIFAPLILSPNGSFYGTASLGGTLPYGGGNGTVFEMGTSGTVWTVYTFAGSYDGGGPRNGLVQAPNGNFYGTTSAGGGFGYGTAFEVTPGGVLTPLQQFSPTNGDQPFSGLVQGSDGNFYGTTTQSGANGYGTIFKLTPGGTLTVLHNFDGLDGALASSTLIQGADGNFYGTADNGGNLVCQHGCGTVFKITPTGVFTVLHSFNGTDGENPQAGLMQGTDGNLYGTTSPVVAADCPPGPCGTIFQITAAGAFETLHTFTGPDGAFPLGGMMQATNGIIYGTTSRGGTSASPYCTPSNTSSCGTVYTLDIGAAPFIRRLAACSPRGPKRDHPGE